MNTKAWPSRDRQNSSEARECVLTDKLKPYTHLLIPIALGFVYLATRTHDYYWDGITFALQIEKVARGERGTSLLFHQNHLLYNAVGYLMYRASRLAGVNIRALTILQFANCAFAAAGAGVFFQITRRVSGRSYTAFACSLFLGLSSVWWKLATDADPYILSVVFILVCASNLLSGKPSANTVGLTLAAAMLMHELASLFYIAVVAAVLASERITSKGKFAARVTLLGWGVTAAVYYLCGWVSHRLTTPWSIVAWAISNPSNAVPSLDPRAGLLSLPTTNFHLFVGHSFTLFRRNIGSAEITASLALSVACLAFLIALLRSSREGTQLIDTKGEPSSHGAEFRTYQPMLITWILAYLVFLLFWEPWQLYYRVFYAPAVILAVAGLLLRRRFFRRIAKRSVTTLGLASFALFNLTFFVLPHINRNSNELVSAARKASAAWGPGTVIYFLGRNEADTAFEYFNLQTRWVRPDRAMDATRLQKEISEISDAGGSVWLNKAAAEALGQMLPPNVEFGEEIVFNSPNNSASYVRIKLGTGTKTDKRH